MILKAKEANYYNADHSTVEQKLLTSNRVYGTSFIKTTFALHVLCGKKKSTQHCILRRGAGTKKVSSQVKLSAGAGYKCAICTFL